MDFGVWLSGKSDRHYRRNKFCMHVRIVVSRVGIEFVFVVVDDFFPQGFRCQCKFQRAWTENELFSLNKKNILRNDICTSKNRFHTNKQVLFE